MTRRWKRFSHYRCVSKYCVEWKLELADMQALFRFIVTLSEQREHFMQFAFTTYE